MDDGPCGSRMDPRLVPADGHQPAHANVECIARPRYVEPLMKGGHDRNPRAPGEFQVPRTEMGMDEVKIVLQFEDQFGGPAERRCRVVSEADRAKRPWDRRNVSPRHPRIAARERRDLVATPIQLVHQLVDDPLCSPVAGRWNGLDRRGYLGDPQRLPGPRARPTHRRAMASLVGFGPSARMDSTVPTGGVSPGRGRRNHGPGGDGIGRWQHRAGARWRAPWYVTDQHRCVPIRTISWEDTQPWASWPVASA